MKPVFKKGQLITWKEDRGFGFIKSEDGQSDVFLHISVLPQDSRRPKVGDTILYQRVVTPKGKVRAAKASIQGVISQSRITNTRSVTHRQKPQKPKQHSRIETIIVWSLLAILGLFYGVNAIPRPGCKIKGNISINTGEKLYHLPGMKDYSSTSISPGQGERWFCSETEAVNNGWRKAPG